MTPAQLAALHSVALIRSEDLLKPLPSIAESAHMQILEFHFHPTPKRAERLAMELDGIRRQILKIREALQREAAGGTPTA